MSQSPRDGRKPFGRIPWPGMWRPEARESRNRRSGYHSFCISAMTSRPRHGGWGSFPAIPHVVRGVKRPLEAYDSGRMGSEGATVMAKLIDCSYCATVSTPRSCDWLSFIGMARNKKYQSERSQRFISREFGCDEDLVWSFGCGSFFAAIWISPVLLLIRSKKWAAAISHPQLFACEAINLSRHASPLRDCEWVSAPFHYIREGFFLGNSLQTRRSFPHVAAKISPMPTVSTKF
jgi:hypothetical protein